jgi:hypothetical protein
LSSRHPRGPRSLATRAPQTPPNPARTLHAHPPTTQRRASGYTQNPDRNWRIAARGEHLACIASFPRVRPSTHALVRPGHRRHGSECRLAVLGAGLRWAAGRRHRAKAPIRRSSRRYRVSTVRCSEPTTNHGRFGWCSVTMKLNLRMVEHSSRRTQAASAGHRRATVACKPVATLCRAPARAYQRRWSPFGLAVAVAILSFFLADTL